MRSRSVGVLIIFLALMSVEVSAAPLQPVSSARYVSNGANKQIYSSEIAPPEAGAWKLAPEAISSEVVHYYLLSPRQKNSLAAFEKKAREDRNNQEQAKLRQGQMALTSNYEAAKKYAIDHGNVGPGALSELVVVNRAGRGDRGADANSGTAPSVFLIPQVQFIFDPGTTRIPVIARKLLMLELHPYLNDGKQWKLYTDGVTVREMVDQQLLTQYGLDFSPMTEMKELPLEIEKPENPSNSYTLLAVAEKDPLRFPLTVALENSLTEEKISLTLDDGQEPPSAPDLPKLFDFARYLEWAPYRDMLPASPVYQAWSENKGWDAYKFEAGRNQRRARPDREINVFSVLGGRAALEETLQTQSLNAGPEVTEVASIPVLSLKGVEVKSHPFESMLAGQEGGRLPLADYVPPDHFFVYSPKPKTLLPLLDAGGDFVANLGGVIQGNNINYDLKNRYLARLGMDGKWMRKFIDAGMLKELAIVTPDLFFIEGTDVTVLSHLAQPGLAKPLLRLIGIGTLAGDEIFTRTTEDGHLVYWLMQDDLLVISTSQSEIAAVRKLKETGGEGSLGKSAEFRYMLTQTPVNPETRCYAYFSDPFIRHLVGPATKIGQLRRLLVRKDLEKLTAGGILARFDGYRGPITRTDLIKAKYVEPLLADQDLSVDQEGVASSRIFGTLAESRPLGAIPLENVTKPEADSYKNYLENYNRYWRQFFDPIAVRLDEKKDGALELTTFILPLLDSSIYTGMKRFMAKRESGGSLGVPVTTLEPLVMFSLNLDNKGWSELLHNFSEFLSRYTKLNAGILGDLGPSLHLAIMDGDPVVALGSGDILGAFNADTVGLARGGGMMLVPVAMSILTRPCALYIESSNPTKTLNYLREVTTPLVAPSLGREGIEFDYYATSGRDEWILSVKIMGLVKLRYSIGIEGKYLVIRNIPWSARGVFEHVQEAQLNGAQLQVFPAAGDLQLPGLFTSAAELDRKAVMQGFGYLYPLLSSGRATLDEAASTHARLFGFKPEFPADDNLTWNRRDLVSGLYGSVRKQKQPPYVKGETNFGLLKDIESLSLNLQFEETGLRTVLNWKLR